MGRERGGFRRPTRPATGETRYRRRLRLQAALARFLRAPQPHRQAASDRSRGEVVDHVEAIKEVVEKFGAD